MQVLDMAVAESPEMMSVELSCSVVSGVDAFLSLGMPIAGFKVTPFLEDGAECLGDTFVVECTVLAESAAQQLKQQQQPGHADTTRRDCSAVTTRGALPLRGNLAKPPATLELAAALAPPTCAVCGDQPDTVSFKSPVECWACKQQVMDGFHCACRRFVCHGCLADGVLGSSESGSVDETELEDYYGSNSAALVQATPSPGSSADQPAPPQWPSASGGAGGSIIDIPESCESDFADNLAKVDAEEADAVHQKVSQENKALRNAAKNKKRNMRRRGGGGTALDNN